MTKVDGSLIKDATIPNSAFAEAVGDMLKSTYDVAGNGKVDVAELAEAVAWGNISGKPTYFASIDSSVFVTASRFVNIAPVSNDLEATLDALDAVSDDSGTITVANSTFGDLALGAAASIRSLRLIYYADRNGDIEMGELWVFTDGTTNVEVFEKGAVSPSYSATDGCGLSFSGQLNAGTVELRITTDASGDSVDIHARWGKLFA